MTDLALFVGFDVPAKRWAEIKHESRDIDRRDMSGKIAEKGYDMNDVAKNLENFYLQESKK